uniref:Uncharacterized protein n=1 Tax=Graphocephala atropunctata TaxID=36148 RepID=A0A1B6MU29_9HEMI
MVSGSLLVLSYTNCFKVIDLPKATFLYEVEFNQIHPESLILQMVSESYYVLIRIKDVSKFTVCLQLFPLTITKPTSDVTQDHNVPVKNSLVMFDFRGET